MKDHGYISDLNLTSANIKIYKAENVLNNQLHVTCFAENELRALGRVLKQYGINCELNLKDNATRLVIHPAPNFDFTWNILSKFKSIYEKFLLLDEASANLLSKSKEGQKHLSSKIILSSLSKRSQVFIPHDNRADMFGEDYTKAGDLCLGNLAPGTSVFTTHEGLNIYSKLVAQLKKIEGIVLYFLTDNICSIRLKSSCLGNPQLINNVMYALDNLTNEINYLNERISSGIISVIEQLTGCTYVQSFVEVKEQDQGTPYFFPVDTKKSKQYDLMGHLRLGYLHSRVMVQNHPGFEIYSDLVAQLQKIEGIYLFTPIYNRDICHIRLKPNSLGNPQLINDLMYALANLKCQSYNYTIRPLISTIEELTRHKYVKSNVVKENAFFQPEVVTPVAVPEVQIELGKVLDNQHSKDGEGEQNEKQHPNGFFDTRLARGRNSPGKMIPEIDNALPTSHRDFLGNRYWS